MRGIHKIYIGIAILLIVMSVLFSTRERFRKLYEMDFNLRESMVGGADNEVGVTNPKQGFMKISVPREQHIPDSPVFDNIYDSNKLPPIPFVSSSDYDATTAFNAV